MARRARQWRTTNPIESSFATVKLRSRAAGSKAAALAIAYKLLDVAEERWRRFNGHELIADVLDGATFKDTVGRSRMTNHHAGREGSPPDTSHAVNLQLLTMAPSGTKFLLWLEHTLPRNPGCWFLGSISTT